jgi:phosphate:Na+ symporter
VQYDFFDFLQLIGSLAVFIFGMKTMSDGIQRAAGEKMRKILEGMTSNRFIGVFTGFLITVLLQTSSGTTVMVVSFVNAGLLTLMQSIGVIMGANIGTTLTAWMIAYFGFKVNILTVAIPLMGIALPFYFHKNKTYKGIAEFFIGFGLLFIGIDFLKNSVPDIRANPEMLSFLQEFTQYGIWSVLLFVVFGTILTIVVQSSSAASAITLALLAQGYIDFTMGAALFLGENIGTTITANLAAMVGNVHAKRAARFHFLFNVFGVVWILLVYNTFLGGIDSFLKSNFDLSPFSENIEERIEIMVIAIAIFHTAFNLTNTLLFIGFIGPLSRLVVWLQPSQSELDEEYHLEYIETGLMASPELSIIEAQKEVAKFGDITRRMLGFTGQMVKTTDKKEFEYLQKKIIKYENITDRIEVEIADFLLKISETKLTDKTSLRIRSILGIIGELERIGDIFYQMSKNLEHKSEQKIWFSPEQNYYLEQMLETLDKAFIIMCDNLKKDYEKVNLSKAYDIEEEVNHLRNTMKKDHLLGLEKGEYNVKSGLIYSDLYNSCEKIGDHIINVSESVAGKI